MGLSKVSLVLFTSDNGPWSNDLANEEPEVVKRLMRIADSTKVMERSSSIAVLVV
jgi:hypothetical protein